MPQTVDRQGIFGSGWAAVEMTEKFVWTVAAGLVVFASTASAAEIMVTCKNPGREVSNDEAQDSSFAATPSTAARISSHISARLGGSNSSRPAKSSRQTPAIEMAKEPPLKAVLFLPVALALCSTPATANVTSDLAAIEARYKACEAKDASGAGMTDCAVAAKLEADKILTKLYRSILTSLRTTQPGDPDADNNKEELKRLLASENAWITYRQAECNLQGIEMLGGSREGLIINGCLYSLTAQRAKDLDELFNGGAAR